MMMMMIMMMRMIILNNQKYYPPWNIKNIMICTLVHKNFKKKDLNLDGSKLNTNSANPFTIPTTNRDNPFLLSFPEYNVISNSSYSHPSHENSVDETERCWKNGYEIVIFSNVVTYQDISSRSLKASLIRRGLRFWNGFALGGRGGYWCFEVVLPNSLHTFCIIFQSPFCDMWRSFMSLR